MIASLPSTGPSCLTSIIMTNDSGLVVENFLGIMRATYIVTCQPSIRQGSWLVVGLTSDESSLSDSLRKQTRLFVGTKG